jgi:hypothetical protein
MGSNKEVLHPFSDPLGTKALAVTAEGDQLWGPVLGQQSRG